jgi:hypothetical protein
MAMGCMAATTTGALAQSPDRMIACASKVEDSERLACYDSAVKALGAEARAASEAREAEASAAKAAAAAAAAAAATRAAAEAEAARKASFGKSAEPSETVSELTASVTEVLTDGNRKAVFVLDNGQIWRHTDGPALPNVKVGSAVTIKRGALGSFRLMPVGSNRSVQVVRMR